MEALAGKIGVITGGGSGIGLATARILAAEGMHLVLADIEEPTLAPAVAEIQGAGVDCLGVATDVGERASVEALAEQALSRFGKVDLLFNNAGVAIEGPIQDMQHADWEWLIRVNLWGVIHGIESFLPRMVERGEGGHIVNTASFAGLVANDGLGVYCVTKYGVVALSECLARELREHGIGVSVLCPMRVHTHIDQSVRNRPVALGGDPDAPLPPVPDPAQFPCETLPVERVAAEVVAAIKAKRLYILPHPESRAFIRRRFERIDRSFEASPGFQTKEPS